MGLEPTTFCMAIARAESDWRKIRMVEPLLGQMGQVRSAYSGTKFGTKIVS